MNIEQTKVDENYVIDNTTIREFRFMPCIPDFT